MNLKNLKLLVFDVDGVLTTGRKTYNTLGQVESKEFNDKDFTAIKRFIEAGIPVIWLSGDANVNEAVAASRNIPFYYAKSGGKLSKKDFVPIFCEKYKCSKENICYIGDDYFDLDIMRELGILFSPSDACLEVRSISRVLESKGGMGVAVEVFNIWQSDTGHKTDDAKLREIDSLEK
jgi:3-deoxy-D-manno-octulosonate 8-phosphate phosphatase (KDO 8-P phosphatase)